MLNMSKKEKQTDKHKVIVVGKSGGGKYMLLQQFMYNEVSHK
jgi:ABC-type polar amino acid transport system ATPase subunit